MSKRFGRNQRRKLREELAVAETKAAAANVERLNWATRYYDDTAMMRQRMERLQGLLDYTNEALARLGPHSAFKPPGTMDVDDPRDPFRLDIPAARRHRVHRLNEPFDERIYVEELEALMAEVLRDPLTWNRHVHVHLRGKNGWAYAISDRALRGGIHGQVQNELAIKLAREVLSITDHELTGRKARG